MQPESERGAVVAVSERGAVAVELLICSRSRVADLQLRLEVIIMRFINIQ